VSSSVAAKSKVLRVGVQPPRASCSRRSQGGRGAKISTDFRPVTARGLTQRFFCGAEFLIIFLEIKEFKPSRARGRETSGITASTWTGPCAQSGSAEAALRGFVFQACLRAGGWSKLWDSEAGTVRQHRRCRREIPKTFLFVIETRLRNWLDGKHRLRLRALADREN
jgi:hypothetical protein